MTLTKEQVQQAASDMGFAMDSLEKVWMLVRLELRSEVGNIEAWTQTRVFCGKRRM
ncbi:hypothetical protein KAI87_01855 [Myxococcota bacterium]|nr:hypothetical protein [Myxococcota bacterium]